MADTRQPPSVAARLYDALLRCYPKAFREEYGRHMRADFLSQWRTERTRGGVPLARFATSVIADTGFTAAREHLHMLHQDIRVAWRALRKAPAFTIAAVATLALGIGATTAMFSVVYAVLLRPLPFREPARLVELVETQPRANIDAYAVSGLNFLSWRERTDSYDAIAALWPATFTLAEAGNPERVEGMQVSANLWTILGVPPIAGRAFDEREDTPGRDKIVLVSDGLWRRRYGSDPAFVGKTIRLSGEPHTIVGIVPTDMGFTQNIDVWVPYTPDPRISRGDRRLTVIGRLKPDVGVAQASAELDSLSVALGGEFPKTNNGYRARVRPLTEMVVTREIDSALKVLLAAVGLLLLVACANVANLVLTRATARAPELALRRALGAGSLRLTRQVLTESLVLASIGGMCGILLAAGGLQIARATLADLPRAWTLSLDGSVLIFACAVTMFTGFAFGMIPAWRVLRSDVVDALRPAGRVVSDRSQTRLRQAFVIGQFCLATTLVIGAALLAQSLTRLLAVDVGFRPDHLLVASVNLSFDKYQTEDQAVAFYRRAIDDLRALPGVTSVGLTSNAPFGPMRTGMELGATKPSAGSPERMRAEWRIATSDYFRALGVPLRRGRLFEEADAPTLQPIIVSESIVRRLWPEGDVDPIGQRVWMGNGQVRTVIGVVGDVHQNSLEGGVTPTMYLPTTWTLWPTMTLIVRTVGEPVSVMTGVRDAIRRIDPDQALFDMRSMEAQMQATTTQWRVNASLLGLFAMLALVLGAVGVAGVVAHTVARRRAELALRMALGATGGQVVRLVAARGLALCACGLVLGVAGALALRRTLSTLLFGVEADDPFVFATVAAVLMAVAAMACWLPASRVTRIDPAAALRGD